VNLNTHDLKIGIVIIQACIQASRQLSLRFSINVILLAVFGKLTVLLELFRF